MIKKLTFFLFAIGTLISTGCQKKSYFDYKLIDGDTAISDFPFSNNQEFVLGAKKRIEYKIINDSIYTSIYISAHAGCSGVEIVPEVKSENKKLFLSIEITKNMFSSDCPVSKIQLNFRLKNNNYQEAYFVIKSIYHPL